MISIIITVMDHIFCELISLSDATWLVINTRYKKYFSLPQDGAAV